MIGPGSSKTRTRYTPSSVALALISKPPQPIVALVPKVGSLGEHRIAVAAKPLHAWDASVPAPKNVRRCSGKAHAVPRQCASGGKGGWFGGAGPECRPNKRKMWVRESWRSISRSHNGSESPTQCVLYRTAMTPPRPRTDWWPVIFSTSSRWRGPETSS